MLFTFKYNIDKVDGEAIHHITAIDTEGEFICSFFGKDKEIAKANAHMSLLLLKRLGIITHQDLEDGKKHLDSLEPSS